MAGVVLNNVSKIFKNKVIAVENFTLDISDQEFVVFVGPSGCGKTTTLRMIAGLEEATGGEIYIDGKLVNNVQAKDRDIAMVFQNYALYPHMTVFENIAFSLKMRKTPKNEIRSKVTEVAKSLDIEYLLDRKPGELSGGQRQRVALGRAIIRKPKVFLMDEPLSNLDAKLRTQMRTEISRLHRELKTTFIYVTHDQTEAMTMGTRIVMMDKGNIQQVASPGFLYDSPCNLFVAGFIGNPQMNFMDAKSERSGERILLKIGGIRIMPPLEMETELSNPHYAGKELVIGIRPEDIYEEPRQKGYTDYCALDVTVEAAEMLGSDTVLHVKAGELSLCARVSSKTKARIGDNMKLYLDTAKIHVFDKESGERIKAQNPLESCVSYGES